MCFRPSAAKPTDCNDANHVCCQTCGMPVDAGVSTCPYCGDPIPADPPNDFSNADSSQNARII